MHNPHPPKSTSLSLMGLEVKHEGREEVTATEVERMLATRRVDHLRPSSYKVALQLQ
jgi:hypothetical protein